MFRKLFVHLGNLIMFISAAWVIFLLLSQQEIAHSGLYTFLGIVAFCLGLLIRRNALRVIKKKKPKRTGVHSWIMNERDDE